MTKKHLRNSFSEEVLEEAVQFILERVRRCPNCEEVVMRDDVECFRCLIPLNFSFYEENKSGDIEGLH